MKCIRKFLLFILFFQIALFFFSCKDEVLEPIKVTEGTFTDTRDGRVYKTTSFGGYTWLAENLDFATDSGSCYYDNDSVNNKICGRLYTSNVLLSAIPLGWHLPTRTELDFISKNFGGLHGVNQLLEIKNNYSKLSVKLGGLYTVSTNFQFKDTRAFFWLPTEPFYWWIDKTEWFDAYLFSNKQGDMFNIRCVKDY